jgi:hypothetical protein
MKRKSVETIEHDYWDDTPLPGVTDPDEVPFETNIVESPGVPLPQPKALYKPVMWKGIIPTNRCETCGYCTPGKDDMILHVLKHVPETEREELFNNLIKE